MKMTNEGEIVFMTLMRILYITNTKIILKFNNIFYKTILTIYTYIYINSFDKAQDQNEKKNLEYKQVTIL